MNFKGMKVLVTGGNSGIGAEVVDRFISEGALVSVIDKEISRNTAGYYAFETDVANSEHVLDAVNQAAYSMSGIDIVVNCAAISSQGNIEANSEEEWFSSFNVNVFGIVRVSRYSLPHLRESRHAAIVNICSVAADVGLAERAVYAATKGAVQSLTYQMAADYLAEGIRVNCVNPGTVDTPWVSRLLSTAADPNAARRALSARQPHGKLVTPAEVANAVLYLADPSNSSIIGVALPVDGGMASLQVQKD